MVLLQLPTYLSYGHLVQGCEMMEGGIELKPIVPLTRNKICLLCSGYKDDESEWVVG